ncbi:N-acetylmuramoyl-L-alanine amidase [Bacillus sp. EB600]|uniref:N-acetylmuramoyl-L-alanine amidase n=1 Tax=Bacillus sp. EB600 TaxID=2806345 RepID=UPI00210918E0|nr:N-acetylmuramoyl-L-alanine amidase [Bacillus sp. EB600]MCQ6280791.1 N-acetylmuramoyl-L-alanine amidase [Bacillus sp. EB600]
MKNISQIRVLAILSVILFSLFVFPSQKYQFKLSSNQTGWVYNDYIKKAKIKTKTPKQETPTENKEEATVGVTVLNVREKPSLTSQVVGKLKLGTKITVHEEQTGWAKVVSSSGDQGWVYSNYITKDVSSNNQTQPVNAPTTSKELFQNSPEPLKGKTIVLDPGHGGSDDGTTSIIGTHEKTLTLTTAQVVEQKLENAGAIVIMTRTNDTYIPLQQRADLSNQNHADAFISFHYNWLNDPSVNGLTDFYYQKSKDNPLASYILKEVVKTTGLNNDGTRFDNLDVLRNNSQPSTLIELGFLSNKQDDSVVESSAYRDNVAQGVYQGLLDYFSTKKQVT